MRRRTAHRWLLVVALSLLAIGSQQRATVRAQSEFPASEPTTRYTFPKAIPPGLKTRNHNEQSETDRFQIVHAGQGAVPVANDVSEVTDYVAEELPTTAPYVRRCRVTFDPKCSIISHVYGQTKNNGSSLAGKTVMLQADAKLNVTSDAGPVPADELRILQMLGSPFSGFPSHPVAVGESWSLDPSQLLKSMNDSTLQKITSNSTLDSVNVVSGRSIATVRSVVSMKYLAGADYGSGTATGTFQIDLATGLALQSDWQGFKNITAPQVGDDPNVTSAFVVHGWSRILAPGTAVGSATQP